MKIDNKPEFKDFKSYSMFDKKLSSDHEGMSFVFKLAPILFISMFCLSFFSAIPEKQEVPMQVITQINPHKHSAPVNVYQPIGEFHPDLMIPYIFNYKVNQNIQSNVKSFTSYLKNPDQHIDFDSFYDKNQLTFNVESNNLLKSLDKIKHSMMLEDLSIMPFKSGEVVVESEIIETTQSEHYYMIEVLKTFTQGKKVVKVLEKKIFNLQLLEKGEIKYFTNILLTSSQDTNK